MMAHHHNCPQCGLENSVDAQFCRGCGQQLTMNCPKCGKTISTNAQYCRSCGVSLDAQSQPPYHKNRPSEDTQYRDATTHSSEGSTIHPPQPSTGNEKNHTDSGQIDKQLIEEQSSSKGYPVSKILLAAVSVVIVIIIVIALNQDDSTQQMTRDIVPRTASKQKAIDQSKKQPVMGYQMAYGIARQKLGNNPDTVIDGVIQGRRVIIAHCNDGLQNDLIGFREFGNTWKRFFAREDITGWVLHELEIVSLEDNYFIYHVFEESGTGSGYAEFSLEDIQSSATHTITVSGAVGSFSNVSDIPPSLKKRPALLSFLEDKIAKSNLVYHPEPDDFDYDKPRNALKRWAIENDGIREQLERQTKDNVQLHLHWYDTNLLKLHGSSRNDSIECGNYMIVSIFKHEVICVDKRSGKSCVLLPRWPYRGFEDIRCSGDAQVILKDERYNTDRKRIEYPEYLVNIRNGTIRRL